MPFQSTQKGIQRGGYDGPYGQTTAFRMFAEKFYGPWWKLQSDRSRRFWPRRRIVCHQQTSNRCLNRPRLAVFPGTA